MFRVAGNVLLNELRTACDRLPNYDRSLNSEAICGTAVDRLLIVAGCDRRGRRALRQAIAARMRPLRPGCDVGRDGATGPKHSPRSPRAVGPQNGRIDPLGFPGSRIDGAFRRPRQTVSLSASGYQSNSARSDMP